MYKLTIEIDDTTKNRTRVGDYKVKNKDFSLILEFCEKVGYKVVSIRSEK